MKKNFIQQYILIPAILLLTCLQTAFAQRYPVQVNTMVTPPYSLKLSDYVESGYDRVQVTINPLDLNLTAYRIKLKLVIESFNGQITIETDPNYLPAPIFLTGGLTEMLSSYDVTDLFDLSHLIFRGYSKNQYLAAGKLPEGYYRIGFEALDYNRATAGSEVSVSNYGFAMAGLFLNDPPILNLPQNGLVTQRYEPQNIIFQWTPRHQGSPNSAFTASYIYRLYEVWNANTDPNLIASTQLPIFETETSQPRLAYGIAEPMLLPGKKYVWRVQVTEPENRDLFRNNGFSEAYLFQYGEECKVPTNLSGEAVNGPGMELSWNGSEGHTDYLVQYRIAGSGEWYDESSLLDNIRIYDLQYGSRYEVQVMAQCGTFSSGYCNPLTLEMPAEPEQQFACGAQNNAAPITNHEPLPYLNPNARFTAGGFQCKVLEAGGSAGTFSGTCLVTVPFYGYAKVLHTFDNISINTDYQMWAGKLIAVKDSARNAVFMEAISDQEWGDGTEYTNEELALIFDALDIVTVEEPIEGITIDEDGDIVIEYEDGTTETIECPCQWPMIVADDDGNQYLIDADGEVHEVTPDLVAAALAESGAESQEVNNIDSLVALLPSIRFAPTDDMKYGYDSMKYEALRGQYTTQQIREQNYVVPFKAVATGEVDNLQAIIPESEVIDPTAISFVANQVPVSGTETGQANNRKLSVTALSPGDVVPLEAYYNMADTAGNTRQELIGQVNLACYARSVYNLHIVPVSTDGVQPSVNTSQIGAYVNEIYAQSTIEWNVTIGDLLIVDDVLNGEQKFDNTDPDDRMDYTAAMKDVYRELKDRDDYDRDDIYMFLIGAETVEGSMTGYMPYKSQFAFVFTENIGGNESLEHVATHEVAHGAFNLRHTFSSENAYVLSQNSTDNLMDYSGAHADRLNKYQWDFIHDPESMLFVWLQDEEEGEIIDFNPVVELDKDKLPVSTGSATFFTPAGLPVYFSDMDKMSKMYFTTSAVNDCFDDEFKKGNCPEVANYIVADIGVLVAFKYDNKFYVPVFESAGTGISGTIKASDNIFKGYYSDGYYIDNYTPANNTYKVYWYQNGWGEPLDFCFDYSSYLNAQYFNKDGYKGAGYYATYMERRTGHSCETYLAGLSDLDNLDFFNSTLSSKYNPWGYNGLLQKIEDREGEIRLVYSEINNGTKEYYEYDYVIEDWVKFDIATAGFTEYLDIELIAEVAQLCGHSALDIIGFIPVAGEVADALNGLWYVVEGEGINATLCFASMLPLIGDVAVKTTKYTLKALKSAQLFKTFELSGEALQSLGRISDLLKAGDNITCTECLETFWKLLADLPDKATDIERLAQKITDADKLKAVLTRIDGLGEAKATFLSDIKLTDNLTTNTLANNLDKLDEDLVDAWKRMDELGADEELRRNQGALDALSKPNGQRPLPETYLSTKQLSDHKAIFDNDDIVRVTSETSIAEHGGTLGGDKAFIIPFQEYKTMIFETGGDLRKIEAKLGFEPGSLKEGDVVFAKIERNNVGEIKMPSGNEGAGVSEKYWIPGGKTSGGISEGVVKLDFKVEYEPL